MDNKVYKYYKERLVEISGRSRSLYSKRIGKKTSYDIGKILDGDYKAIHEFVDFLWNNKRESYPIINNTAKPRICRNLKVSGSIEKQFTNERKMTKAEKLQEEQRRLRVERDEEKKALLGQVNSLKVLKREIEELERETGRYELFVGYPFIEGTIGRDTIIRAPLLLFPASIHIENETTAEIEMKPGEPVQLNKVFILAYAQRHKLDIDDMELEFSSLHRARLRNVDDVINYLRGFGFKIGYPVRKGMFNFEKAKEPHPGDPLEVKNYAVIGRFPLANAIYNDYNLLAKRKPTQAIKELLDSRSTAKKPKETDTDLYAINSLDFAQEEAIEKLNRSGNMVIYGPPGTGKSQTIVNIITDALCKNKRVLVVSQKKAALDVVYNRLGKLNDRAMYVVDPEKGKADFYARTKATHLAITEQKGTGQPGYCETKYQKIKGLISNEVDILETITDTLWGTTGFGISLQEMYANGCQFGRNILERRIYEKLVHSPELLRLKFHELDDAIRVIKEKRKDELYYKHLEIIAGNPIIANIKDDLSVHTIGTVNAFIDKLLNSRIVPFNFSKYPNARQLLAFYFENGLTDPRDLTPLVKFIAKIERKKSRDVISNFSAAMEGVKSYVDEYALLESVLDKQGFAVTLENILNGNTLFLKLLTEALNNYVAVRDMNINLRTMTDTDTLILNFAYETASSIKEFKEVIDKLIPARIYHEIVYAEERYKNQLSKIMDFENVKNRIVSLKTEQHDIVKQMCLDIFKQSYVDNYNSDPENKNFFYQIGKAQNLWPIRKLMEHYSDLMLNLFPCWLLSPENVSTIMPLTEGLFDLILFDEASQIFIESTLPTIYRGKHIAIAGDNKQLRPTALFMRRYMGNDIDDLDLDTQAALEVDSLLDLATSRYNSINLNYHYRSSHEEFITFSNYAFYDCQLQIAPNLTKNNRTKPIERIKVDGKWIDRKNRQEAAQVVTLLKKIFRTRREHESVGIITFNAEQEQYIKDLIDAECKKDSTFGNAVRAEYTRRENGEDISLFIKNIENVQGDERDIIIFSIGYAANEYGKVVSQFGPLNLEGGENRLNVAITRAKKKIYVITSIEPEELVVENTKNPGPKIFKKYLQYVRAVSGGHTKEVEYILEGLKMQNNRSGRGPIQGIAGDLKAALEKQGWTVEMDLGNNSYKLSLAIYDKSLDKYLVGIECDDAAFRSSASILERDVFRSKFMESRGWKILRVWSRDWWLNPAGVVARISRTARKRRESLSV